MLLQLLIWSHLLVAAPIPFKCKFSDEKISGSFSILASPFVNEYKFKVEKEMWICSFSKREHKKSSNRIDIILTAFTCNHENKKLISELSSKLRIEKLRSGRSYAFFTPHTHKESLPCIIESYEPKDLISILEPPKVKSSNQKKFKKKRVTKDKRAVSKRRVRNHKS